MKSKRTVALVISFALMILAVPVIQTGCFPGYPIVPAADSLFGIVGKVYEWVNAPLDATGEVIFQEAKGRDGGWGLLDEMGKEASRKYKLVPLGGVDVTAHLKSAPVWDIKASSDAQGLFVGGVTIPVGVGEDYWVLRFSKSGYEDVTMEMYRDKMNYDFIVVMVRESSPSLAGRWQP